MKCLKIYYLKKTVKNKGIKVYYLINKNGLKWQYGGHFYAKSGKNRSSINTVKTVNEI